MVWNCGTTKRKGEEGRDVTELDLREVDILGRLRRDLGRRRDLNLLNIALAK